jgi:hypothetical protein
MWANRGRGQMIVWLAATDAVTRPTPADRRDDGKVTTSPARRNVRAINDGEDRDRPTMRPLISTGGRVAHRRGRCDSRGDHGLEIGIYWFDDTGRGQVRVPASWRLLYRDGDAWKPVTTSSTFGVDKDRYNKVSFTPVTTTGLRVEVKAQSQWSSGIQEWKVREGKRNEGKRKR